jgi:hypothetical protein
VVVVVVVVVKQHHPFASFCHSWPLGTLSTNNKMRVRTKIDLGKSIWDKLYYRWALREIALAR